MKEKVRAICEDAVKGKLSAKVFYEKINAIAEDENTDGDLSALLEDAIMELEMEGGSSAGVMKKVIREAAEMILEGLR